MLRVNRLEQIFNSDRKGVSTLATIALSACAALIVGLLVALLGGPIALGAVLGLFVLAQILRQIEVGFAALAAVICLVPFAALPINIGFKPTFLDLIILALYGVWMLERATGKLGRFVSTPLTIPVLVFLALALASFTAGLGYAPLTANIARHFAEIVLSVVLYFLIADSVRQPVRLRSIVRMIIIGGSIAAVLAIVLYLLPHATSIDILSRLKLFGYPEGPGVLRFINDDPSLPQRATGTSIDPNALGGLLIMTLTLGAPQLFSQKPVLPRFLILLGLGCMGSALLLSFSRGSFLGTGVALFVLGVLRYRKLLLIMVVALTVILILPQTQAYVTHFFQGVQGQDLATQMRFGEYSDALKLIQRYPVLGVGFTGSPDLDTYLSVASVYLLMAGEMGLVGLAAFLILMLTLLVSAWRNRRAVANRSDVGAIWWGLHAALIGALVGGIFDHYFFNLDFHHSVTLFWLYIGLAAVATRMVQSQPATIDQPAA
ncbi:MAG TPA: O-antigen ligase family protein [Anaerolineae bacterium]|nr:O-antigen ligase family protein [Anaerolineae bacterium]